MSLLPQYIQNTLDELPQLEATGQTISKTVHQLVMKGGTPARKVADVLHGTWLGHPLHPILTDITIGAWALGALFDAVGAIKGDHVAREAGDRLALVGTISAVPTIITGLIDFSTIQKPATSVATLHAVLNDINLVLYVLSVRDRRRGNHKRGLFFSFLALGLTTVAAWLGGVLVYDKKVGVDHSESRDGPENWTPVLAAADLPRHKLTRVEADGSPILLYRTDDAVQAIGAVCSHAGGPLEEGSVEGCYVQCPWHDSVFDLRDGSVYHGPATSPQPRFAVREREGQLEVRLQRK